MTKDRKNAALKNWAVFSGLGLQMGLVIYLGNLVGSWLDTQFNTSFLEEIVTLIAVFGAMFMVVYRVNRMHKK